jgi:hypothetical protein
MMRSIKKPSQFDDPAIDTLLSIVLSLGNEVYVLRERMRIIETLLEAKGTISRVDIDKYQPAPEEAEAVRDEADAFVSRLLRTFEGNHESNHE